MNDFLVKKTGNVDGKDVHMRPQGGNSGKTIRKNFALEERRKALAEFYKGPRAKYEEVAKDFFDQNKDLK